MPEPTVLARYGLLLVFVNVLLDQAGVPVPAVPLLTVAPPLAGALGISMIRFALVSSLSGLVWASGLVGIGWLFRDSINEVTQRIEALGVWALVLVLLLFFGYVAFFWWRRRRGSIEETDAAERPRLLKPARTTP